MKKRVLSFAMALVMLFTTIPLPTQAQSPAYHPEGSTIWLPENVVPAPEEYPVDAENGYQWTETGETDRQLVCGVESHGHNYNCAEDCPLVHTHGDDCYEKTFTCGIQEHEHNDSCYTTTYSCGMTENSGHSHEDDCYQYDQTCGLKESEGHVHVECKVEEIICGMDEGEGAHAHGDGCYDAEGTLICTTEESEGHQHVESCYNITYTCGLEEGAGAHEHIDSCFTKTETLICGKNEGDGAHTHDDTCNPTSTQTCTITPHSHSVDTCTWEKNDTLVCGKDDTHVCITDGCPQDCTDAHHTDGCYTGMVQWGVANYGIATLAENNNGLPIHFFVTTLDQAQNVWGSYKPYKESSWGTENGQDSTIGAYAVTDILEQNPAIKTEDGIRANMTESEIIRYVSQWPGGVTADEFRQFTETFTFGWNSSYPGSQYEVQWVTICWRDDTTSLECGCSAKYDKGDYPHIHIDGILTKKIVPGTMKLQKQITQVQPVDQTFEFKLYQLALNDDYDPTTTRLGSIDMIATIPAGQTTATIAAKNNLDADNTNDVTIGFGYYELVEEESNNWKNTHNLLGTGRKNPGSVFINVHTDGSVQYSTNATSGYTSYTDGATIVNAPDPKFTVNYEFYADNDSILTEVQKLVSPPKDSSFYSANDTVAIDASNAFPKGRQVENLETGKIYTFQGWDSYGTTRGQNSLNNATSIKMPGNNITVYGKWTEDTLDKATGYINVTKIFNGLPLGTSDLAGKQLAYPERYHVAQKPVINNVQGDPVSTMMAQSVALNQSTLEEAIGTTTQAVWSGEKYAYSADGIFLLEEHNYTVPGYSVQVSIDAKLLENHVKTQTKSTGDGLYMAITLPHESQLTDKLGILDDAEDLGTVTFINTYTKNIGEPIQVLPEMDIHKLDARGQGISTPAGGTGAAFTLYKATKDAETGAYTKTEDVCFSGTTDASGHLSLVDLQPGDYVLVETAAPTGYLPSNTEYGFSVILESEAEVLINNQFVKQSTYVITGSNVEAPASAGLPYHMHIHNQKQNGSITISKQFYDGTTDISSKANGYIDLSLIGPYQSHAYENGTETTTEIPGIAPGTIDLRITNTQNGWTTTRSDLPYGYYKLTENMASINGYYWDKSQTQINVGDDTPGIGIGNSAWIHVSDDSTIDVSIVNHYHELVDAELWIQKVDANNTARGLDGAVFGLFSSLDANDQPVYTTHAGEGAGFLHIDGINQAGTYCLKEITAPANYQKLSDNQYWTVVVEAVKDGEQVKSYRISDVTPSTNNTMGSWSSDSAQQTLVIKNEPILAGLTIEKKFEGLKYNEEPAEINVTVTGPNGYQKIVALTKANGYKSDLTGLYLGEYTVAEVSTNVNGYKLTGTTYQVDNNATNKVTLNAATDNPTITVINTYTENRVDNPTSLTIVKHASGTHEALSGALFTLHEANCSSTNCTCATATTNEHGTAVFSHDVLLSDEKHPATYQKTYRLVETSAPDGYIPTSETWTVTVKEKDEMATLVVRQDGSNIWDHIYDWITGVVSGTVREEISVYSNGTLYVHNTPKAVNINVTKVEKFFNGPTEVTDPDVIQLLRENVKINDNPAIASSYTFTREGNSTFTLGGSNGMSTSFQVNFGDTYSIEEAAGNYNTTVTNSQSTAAVNGNTTSGKIEYTDLGQDINVTFTNTYRFNPYNSHDNQVVEDQMTGCVVFTKVFSDNPTTTPTAAFTLYKKDAHGNLQQVGDSVSNDTTGKVHFDIHEPGTYVLKETTTPNGYKTAEDVEFTVTKVYNTRTVTDGNTTTTYITKELVVPTIGSDGKIVNEKNRGVLTLEKFLTNVADADKQNASVVMHVHGPVAEPVTDSSKIGSLPYQKVTLQGNSMSTTLEELEKGYYYIHEAFASLHAYNWQSVTYQPADNSDGSKDGYVLVHIKDDTPSSVTATNTYKKWETHADFTVFKKDKLSQIPIEDVEFILHTGTGHTSSCGCRAVKTDGTGHALFDNLQIDTNDSSLSITYKDGNASEATKYVKTYYLTETKHPGFEANNEVYKVELIWENKAPDTQPKWDYDIIITPPTNSSISSVDHNTDKLTIENVPVQKKIKLTKEFDVNSNLQKSIKTDDGGITSVSFDILDSTNKVVDTLTVGTNNEWTDTSIDLRLGTYTIVENGAERPRYDLVISYSGDGVTTNTVNDSATIVLSEDSKDTIAVTATNKYTAKRELMQVPDTFQVYKVDEDNHPLPGAKFTLHAADCSNLNGAGECTCQTQETDSIGYATFTVSGSHESTDPTSVPSSTEYVLKETKAPDGYYLPEISWTVTVSDDNGSIKVEEHPTEDKFVSIIDWIAKLFTTGTHASETDSNGAVWYAYDNELLTVKNVPKTTELKVQKDVVIRLDGLAPDNDTLAQLLAAADTLIAEEYQIQADINGQYQIKSITEANPAVIGIAYGDTYKVTEIIPENAAFISTVSSNGEGTIGLNDQKEPVGQTVTVTNTYDFKSFDAITMITSARCKPVWN